MVNQSRPHLLRDLNANDNHQDRYSKSRCLSGQTSIDISFRMIYLLAIKDDRTFVYEVY
jgi:hypothetical protein